MLRPPEQVTALFTKFAHQRLTCFLQTSDLAFSTRMYRVQSRAVSQTCQWQIPSSTNNPTAQAFLAGTSPLVIEPELLSAALRLNGSHGENATQQLLILSDTSCGRCQDVTTHQQLLGLTKQQVDIGMGAPPMLLAAVSELASAQTGIQAARACPHQPPRANTHLPRPRALPGVTAPASPR